MSGAGARRLTLNLIGPFALSGAGGQRIDIRSKKARALVALLALAPSGVHARGWLQTILWGSRFREQAQSSLRRELATLCAALDRAGAGDLVRRGMDEVRLDLDAIEIDVLRLGLSKPAPGEADQGVFLEGLDLPDCEEFADWLTKQRARIADLQRLGVPAAASAPGAVEIAGGPLQPVSEILQERALSLPPKPSVCAVPFRPIGRHVEEFLGPAVAEELSITLARFPSLFVVASGSAAALAERSLDPVEIAIRLGVAYVVDGTVMQEGRKVRVAVSLVDGRTGDQVWADAFTGHRDDIFDLQQRVATAIAPMIHTQIDLRELRGALANPMRSGDSYALYWRANALFRQWDEAAIGEAIGVCETLLAMQPTSAWAASMAAFCHAVAYASGWTGDAETTRRTAVRHYQAAVRHGADDPSVLGYAAGTLVCIGGDLDVADRLIAQALVLLPSYQPTLFWGGWVDIARGEHARARERFELSLRINPMAGVRAYAVTGIGLSHLMQGSFREAYDLLREASQYIPEYPFTAVGLAVAAAMVGEKAVARETAAALKRRGGVDRVIGVLADRRQRDMVEAGLRFAEQD